MEPTKAKILEAFYDEIKTIGIDKSKGVRAVNALRDVLEKFDFTPFEAGKNKKCPRCKHTEETLVKPVTYDCVNCGATWQDEFKKKKPC